jgi:hypothetical protein
MGIYDSIENFMKSFMSRRREVKEVDKLHEEMIAINERIREQIYLIGQFYWKKYYDGEYAPGDDQVYFDTIDDCNREMKERFDLIQNCQVNGVKERNDIEEDISRRITKRKEDADKRKEDREAERERRRKEKEDLRIENDERRRLEKIRNDRLAKENAAAKARQKADEARIDAEKAAENLKNACVIADEKVLTVGEHEASKERAAVEKASKKAEQASERAKKLEMVAQELESALNEED